VPIGQAMFTIEVDIYYICRRTVASSGAPTIKLKSHDTITRSICY